MNTSTTGSVRFQLSRQAKRQIYSSTIIAVILVLTLGQPHAGFLVLALMMPFAVWLTYSAFIIVKRPYARAGQLICVFVWMVAIALVSGIHYVWHDATRRDANEIVLAIREFSVAYGRCPQSLDVLGLKREQLVEKLGDNFGYTCAERKPKFFYVATFTIFDTFDYDFERGIWKYESWANKKKFLDTRPPGMK